jgi:acyl carrier protein
MTYEEIVKVINNIMIEDFEIDPSILKPEASLGEDLELDSLDAVDLVVAIEKKLGVRIEETEARAMRTLNDIYEYAKKHAGDIPNEQSKST